MSAVRDPGFVPWPAEVAARYRAQGLWTDDTFASVLTQLAARHGERTAVVDAAVRLSYAELASRAEQLARGMAGLGIGPGDAVIVQLPNCAAFVEVCFALFRLGARPVMAQPAHRALELTHFVQKTRAVAHVVQATWAGYDYRALSSSVRETCPSLRHTLVIGDAGAHVALASLYQTAGALPEPPVASDIALFQLSGGSTNVPKLIARTHADYAYSVRQSVGVCGFDQDTVYLVALPAAHNFPLSSPGILGALFAGGTVVLSASPVPDVAFPWIARERVTATALVPALLPAWLSAAKRARPQLASLNLLQVGGAKLREDLAQRVVPELGCRLQQVFGMAEGLLCYTRLDDPRDQVVRCQGRPMSPHDEVRIVDDADRDVPEGELGHLLTRGPYTIRGYYDAAAHNAEAFTSDGFYRTGDLVRRLADQSLVVEGRAKDQINRGGEKVAAPEVETQLCTHPDVEDAALVAMPDPYLGERSCAFVVAKRALTPAQLIAHLKARGLAAYKIPDRFELVPTLPKTAVGKIDKTKLRAIAASLVGAHNQRAVHASEERP